jgi:hypothetical protein
VEREREGEVIHAAAFQFSFVVHPDFVTPLREIDAIARKYGCVDNGHDD